MVKEAARTMPGGLLEAGKPCGKGTWKVRRSQPGRCQPWWIRVRRTEQRVQRGQVGTFEERGETGEGGRGEG